MHTLAEPKTVIEFNAAEVEAAVRREQNELISLVVALRRQKREIAAALKLAEKKLLELFYWEPEVLDRIETEHWIAERTYPEKPIHQLAFEQFADFAEPEDLADILLATSNGKQRKVLAERFGETVKRLIKASERIVEGDKVKITITGKTGDSGR